jgi:hypothetical protein
MRGAIPPIPQYVFIAWCLVKYRNSFTFYLYTLHFGDTVHHSCLTLPAHCLTHISDTNDVAEVVSFPIFKSKFAIIVRD